VKRNLGVELAGRRFTDFAHALERHFVVRLILQVLSLNLAGNPSYVTEEEHHAAARVVLHQPQDLPWIQGLLLQPDEHAIHADMLADTPSR